MPLPVVNDDVSLAVLLRERALAIPRRWLSIQCAAGLVQTGVSLLRHPRGWPSLALGGICLVLLALWSLSEQRLVDANSHALLPWRLLRGVSAVLGLVSLFALLSALVSGLIGTWIS